MWILNHAPLFLLLHYNFFVDRFHWKDHTLCSWFFNVDGCRGLDGVNTQVCSPTYSRIFATVTLQSTPCPALPGLL